MYAAITGGNRGPGAIVRGGGGGFLKRERGGKGGARVGAGIR